MLTPAMSWWSILAFILHAWCAPGQLEQPTFAVVPTSTTIRNALMSLESNRQPAVEANAPLVGAFILGFAFGAFFDGILLHQILQWHHLLSLVQGDLYRDVRVQILADGLFHAAAYLLAAGGLVLLWRGGQVRPADRIVLGWAVLGFAAWQFADVILVHWAIGLHRVRVDVPNPLLWTSVGLS